MRVAVLGGGTGMSQLLRGLKKLPFDISAIVSVCDDGSSTGRLREEFHTPAVGDIRKVLISLSENEEEIKRLFDYRFDTFSDLNGHALGNLLLTGAAEITGNVSDGIELVNSLLKLKGKVIPLTEDDVVLMGKMESGSVIMGEHLITEYDDKIKSVYYKEKPEVNPDVLKAIREADAIILSMGSLFTSIIPNLLCKEVRKEIDNSKAKLMYVCNIMTQKGETEHFTDAQHVKVLHRHLKTPFVDTVLVNIEHVPEDYMDVEKYDEYLVQVTHDFNGLREEGCRVVSSDFLELRDGGVFHDGEKVVNELLRIVYGVRNTERER